jgi:hypothetical protein
MPPAKKKKLLGEVPVGFQAHAQPTSRELAEGEGNYEGVIRFGGKTILLSADTYHDPRRASQIAISEFVEILRDVVRDADEFVYEKQGA